MKTLRKSILLVFVAVFSLAIGLFAAACGGSKITVSYDLGDGTAWTNEVNPGTEMGLPAPEREGYFFGGWYENAQFTGEGHEGSMTAPEKDTTYYARWLKGYNLTLELNGGSIGGKTEAQTVLVPETGKLLEWIGKTAGGTPQRGSLAFGAWLRSDETEVTETDVMPSSDLTLKAGFKVGYTVEVYAQTAPYGTEYEKNDQLSYTDSDYLGKTVDIKDHAFVNYVVNPNYESEELPTISRLDLQEDASKNAFRVYCDRATFKITYNVNLPQSGLEYTGKMGDTTYVYGETAYVAKNMFAITGYRFAGWTTQSSGNVIQYRAGGEVTEGNLVLYAVWDKGIKDVFGSTDYIYFPNRAGEAEAILVRGGYEFTGYRGDVDAQMHFTLNSAGTFVSFRDDSFIAKIMGDFFSLYYENRVGTYTFYDGYWKEGNGDHYDKNTTLTLDSFNTATLVENGTSKPGTYEFDPEAKEFVLKIRGNSDKYFTFGMKGEQKFFSYLGREKGDYAQFIRVGIGGSYYLGTQTFLLDGYGNVIRRVEGYQDQIGTYEPVDMNDPVPVAKLHFDEFNIYICLNPLSASSGQDNCIQMDDDLMDHEFKSEDDGDERTIKFDGIGSFRDSAVLTDDDGTHEYDYYVERNMLGMFIYLVEGFDTEVMKVKVDVTNHTFSESKGSVDVYQLFASNGSYNYLGDVWLALYDEDYETLTETPDTPEGEEGKDQVKYKVEENSDENEIPKDAKRAEVYMLNRNGNYDLVYKGYTYESKQKLPAFKAMSWIDGRKNAFYTDFLYGTNTDYSVGPMFYYLLDSYKQIDGSGKAIEGAMNISTIYSFWERDSKEWDKDAYEKRYEGGFLLWNTQFQDTTAYGTGMEGIGSYYVNEDGEVLEGSVDIFDMFQVESQILGVDSYAGFTYRDPEDRTQLVTIYFAITMDAAKEVEGEDGEIEYRGWGAIFHVVENRPMFLQDFKYEMAGGSFSQGYDGLIIADDGETAYYYDSVEKFQASGSKPDKGKVEYISEMNGYPVYNFKGEDNSTEFEFSVECFNPGAGPRREQYYFHVYNPDFDKTYSVEGGGTLELDGFGTYALYTDKYGVQHEGGFIFEDDDHQRLATYHPTSATGISLDLVFEITGENTVRGQSEEEKQAYFVLFNSAGVFPTDMPQAAILFDAKTGEVRITQIGEYIWWTQGELEYDQYKVYAVGKYVVVDEEDRIYDLTLSTFNWATQDPEAQNVKWRVRIEDGGYCFVMDAENVYGSYVDEDNNVYYLDGWGEGCYIDAEGNRFDGVHQLMGSQKNGRYYYGAFGGVEGDPELLYANRFDTETHTFEITNRPDGGWVTYYAEDFGAVEFCQVFAIDNSMIGYWFLDDEGELLIYEFDWEIGFVELSGNRYVAPDFSDPDDEFISPDDANRIYYRYNPEKSFEFTGKVVIDVFEGRDDLKDGAQKTEITDLKLEFKPDGTALLNAPATLHFKDFDGKEEDLHYTVILSHASTYQSAAGYLVVDAWYNDVPFHLDLKYDHDEPEKATFVLHAGGGDILWSDYLATELPDYVFYNYGRITSGSTVSIGPKSWKFSEWISDDGSEYDVDNNMLISGVVYTPDGEGNLLTFSAFYEDIFGNEYKDDSKVAKVDEEKVISHDATMAALRGGSVSDWPVYELLVKGGDGLTYSVWLEKLSDSYGNWSTIIYAVSIYQEYDPTKPAEGQTGSGAATVAEESKDGEHYVYRAWLYCGAYYANFVQRSLYTLDVEKVTQKDGKEVRESILQGYDGARWYDNVVIMYHANLDTGLPLKLYEDDKTATTPDEGDEPATTAEGDSEGEGESEKDNLDDMIMIEFKYDDDRLVIGASHTTNVEFVILKDETTNENIWYNVSFFIVRDNEDKVTGTYLCNGIEHNKTKDETGAVTDNQTEYLPNAEKRAEQTTGQKVENEENKWTFEFETPYHANVTLTVNDEAEEGEKYTLDMEVEYPGVTKPDDGDEGTTTTPDDGGDGE